LTVVLIAVLGLAWIAFLAPTILRARNNQGRADSVGDFHHRLRALGRTNGTQRKGPRPHRAQPIHGPVRGTVAMSPAQRRRRDVLLVLAALVGITFVLAVVTRSTPFIALQLLADAALAGYVYLLVQHKQRAQAQRRVRPIPGAPVTPATPAPYVPYPAYQLAEIDLRDAERSRPRLVPLRQTAS
jgi:hypothetical protein